MAKDDAPAPERPPAKRRALERAPDLWLAVWAESEALTPSERRRVQEERDRRKRARGLVERRVGVIVGREGVGGEQLLAVHELLGQLRPTEIHHAGVPRNLHAACKHNAPKVIQHRDDQRAVVLNSQQVVCIPRSASPEGDVWDLARYARDRKLGVNIVLPDGGVLSGIPQTRNGRAASMLRT